MRIALATCAAVPGGATDDRPLWDALARQGLSSEAAIWDDPAVDWSVFDACVLRSTWDYMDRRPAFLDWARCVASTTRLFNPAEVVAWNTHKGYLHELEGRGIEIPPTVWLRRGEPVRVAELMAMRGWRRAIAKPCIGATARETLRFSATVEGLAEAQTHLERMLATEDMMLQPDLETVETEGELSAVFVDGRLTHAVRKVPVPGDFRVQDDFGASDRLHELTTAERESAQRVVELLGSAASPCPVSAGLPMLYARVDFLFGDDGRLLLSELELVEPMLFFRRAPHGAEAMASALRRRCG